MARWPLQLPGTELDSGTHLSISARLSRFSCPALLQERGTLAALSVLCPAIQQWFYFISGASAPTLLGCLLGQGQDFKGVAGSRQLHPTVTSSSGPSAGAEEEEMSLVSPPVCPDSSSAQFTSLPSLSLPSFPGTSSCPYIHIPYKPPVLAISASLAATEARGSSLCPRGWGSRRISVLVRTYRGSNWPRTSWDSFRSSWSRGPWWARGPRGTLDPRLSLFTLQFVKQELQQAQQTLHTTSPRAQGRPA